MRSLSKRKAAITQYYSRISSFTGIPAIIGEPFHEYMWRGDTTGWYSSRLADIKTLYEEPDQTVVLMKKYNATLLYVGDSEREKYTVNLPAEGLVKVYSDGDYRDLPADLK